MKRKILISVLTLLLITSCAIPIAQAYSQDIGHYNGTMIGFDYTVYPTSRYRYAATPMIDNNEWCIVIEVGSEASYYTGAVNSSGDRVTYEYINDSGYRLGMGIQYSAPINRYYRLRHKCYIIPTEVTGSWAPNKS